ncbi:MAG: M14 family metallopeptidase, partial [Acidobacteriota bacterium]|nr:M14 family metallopeptidase [Acidobacteriota bacterium]
MRSVPTIRRLKMFVLPIALAVFCLTVSAQPAPKDVLGFTPGEDYKLAHWSRIVEYFQKLDAASDRVVFKEIGKTTMGKPFTYALISSPRNLRRLEYYKDINDKLADPRKIKRSQKEAAKLVKKGKTFVLITHGIHSTEVGSTLSSTLIAHKLATSKEKRILDILDNTIIVIVPSLNPDGVDIVKDWYDKTLGTKFEGTSPPELYHKYVGHDNNRDWYAFTQVETQLTVEKIHNVYHPQIVHDIHQQGTNGARYFVPPYLDPVEPNVPEEIIEGYTEIGNHIAAAMRREGKLGITTASTYDAWTPARAYSHYHGGARILSETASARLASPIEIKFEDMTSRRGFDVNKESRNYGPLWK